MTTSTDGPSGPSAFLPGALAGDPELHGLLERELERQRTNLQLIASENFTSPAVLAATASVLTNKYSEGYPGRRYYGGNAVADQVEDLARSRATELFGAEHANVQPHAARQREPCRLPRSRRPRRHDSRHAPRPGRPPHPRLARQHHRASCTASSPTG